MRSTLFAGAAVLLAIGTASAAPTLAGHSTTAAQPPAGNPKLKTLYTNGTDSSGIGIVSQKFEKTYKTYSSAGADDFVVPTGKTWTISEVDVPGQYFNGTGPATSENVVFYADAKGKPGKAVAKVKNVKGTDTTGSFAITLASPVKLTAGTYWVSVQANLAFSKGGEWGWGTTMTSQTGTPAVWSNPGDGFATGCKKFTTLTTCIASGEGPDFLFTLKGKG